MAAPDTSCRTVLALTRGECQQRAYASEGHFGQAAALEIFARPMHWRGEAAHDTGGMMAGKTKARRLNRTTGILAALAVALGLGGALAARVELLPKLAGFGAVMAGLVLALIAVALGLVALARAVRARTGALAALIGLLVAGGYAGVVLAQLAPGFSAPEIHDVTTDLADPPAFRALPLAEDNLRGVGSEARWRELHAAAYPDLQPVRLDLPPAIAVERAAALARARGWEIALADPAAGRLEATDRVSLIGFADDIVVVATPGPNGGSIVNARSVSRVGASDLGVNARRLREFLAALRR